MGSIAGDRFLSKALNILNLQGGAALFKGKGEHGNTKLWQQIADSLGVDMSNLRRRVWLGPTAADQKKKSGAYQSLMQIRMPYYRTTHAPGESGTTTDRSVVECLVESLIEACDTAKEGKHAEQKRAAAAAADRARKQEAQDGAFKSAGGRGAKRHKQRHQGTPAAGSHHPPAGSGDSSDKSSKPKGRPSGGKQFGYGGGTTGKGFTCHPALNRLKMETIVQKAWWELDQAELLFYKDHPTPTTEATTESDHWPRGYKVENIDGSLRWKHLHRHEDEYALFICEISEEQVTDLETYMDWLQQQEPQTVNAVALLHGALDAQPPISTRGSADAMGEMAENLKASAQLQAAVMNRAIDDRAAARKDGQEEAEKVRIAQAAEAQKVRDSAAKEAQADRELRKLETESQRDVMLAAINSGRAGPAAAASSSLPPQMSARERMLQLSELLDAQLVTKEEYDAKRQAILDGV